MIFKQILKLNKTEYLEKPVGKLKPKSGEIGAHTINFSDQYIVLDRAKKVFI